MGNFFSWLDIVVSVLIYRKFFYVKWKNLGRKKFLINTLFYSYITIVIYLTLMPILSSLPFILNSTYKGMHLLPFDDYFQSNGDATFQIIINIIMFLPFGFLLPQVKRVGFIKMSICAFLLTLSIELLQPLINSYRISDITDVITNTFGAMLGYCIFRLYKTSLKLLKSH